MKEILNEIRKKTGILLVLAYFVFEGLGYAGVDFTATSASMQEVFVKSIISLLIVLIIAIVWVATSRKQGEDRFELQIHEFLKINVFKGDLWEQADNIVIPVNEYFDTLVDDEIVSRRTLHGQFVCRYFDDNADELDKLIEVELSNLGYLENQRLANSAGTRNIGLKPIYNKNRKKGKKQRFEVGTTIRICVREKHFFLVVASKLNEHERAYIEPFEYSLMLDKMLTYIHLKAQSEAVHMPMIGTGQSGAISEKEFIPNFVHKLKQRPDVKVKGGFNIILPENSLLNLWDIKKTIS